MSKKSRPDGSGDSDELQALFDSIAADPAGARSEVPASMAAVSPLTIDDSGDSDELQALFDAVSEQSGHGAEAGADASFSAADDAAAMYRRLGQLTRQVHDSLRELGLEGALKEAAEAIPDARQRLGYIAQTTEQAASRVLNATDVARPIQDELAAGAEELKARWDALFAGKLSPEAFRELSADTRGFLGAVGEGSRTTSAQLHEIMMAQDFQDLTGQVIKRVVDLAQMLETQLLQVLLEAAPPQLRQERHGGLLNGPVIDASGRTDVVTSQAQVNDLLESLGF